MAKPSKLKHVSDEVTFERVPVPEITKLIGVVTGYKSAHIATVKDASGLEVKVSIPVNVTHPKEGDQVEVRKHPSRQDIFLLG